MKCILFCQNNYSFGILEPLKHVLEQKGYPFLWYINPKIITDFPFKNEAHTTSIGDLEDFNSDAIFVPGNEVPYYLRGVKVQVFHGFAGEKKGHFRIRHYFDLYLTQGPFFTRKFLELQQKFKNFDVVETGWPKLDIYSLERSSFENEKREILTANHANKIILYAPTFSPKLTSAPYLLSHLKQFALSNPDYLILLKFHPLMAQKWIDKYQKLAQEVTNIKFETEKNIIKYLVISDLLISDTSSVIYEFLLLDKPVITFNTISNTIYWENSSAYSELEHLINRNIKTDDFAEQRKIVFKEYHPYQDGKSALRMVEAVEKYIETKGIPVKRNLSFLRKYKIHSIFGKSKRS